MSLASALNIAQSALGSVSRQTSIVSRNVTNAGDSDYHRREAALVSTAPGLRATEIRRAADELLLRRNLSATSAWSGQSALRDGLERLSLNIHGVDGGASVATALGKLSEALQTFASSPSNRTLATNAVEAGRAAVGALNTGAQAVQTIRAEADAGISTAVGELRGLLEEFGRANDEVVLGAKVGRDVSDALDQRDAALKKIAALVPVSTFTRAGNDAVIMTADGATLFETVPREISFAPTAVFTPGAAGNAVLIDGVPLKGGPNASGQIAGLIELRDGAALGVERQLDEMARLMIAAFRETDQTGSGLPDRAGLFGWSGGPALPPAGTLQPGLAGAIRLNAAFDAGAGGDPLRLRDGGANGAAYNANPAGNASFSALLIRYGDRMEEPVAVDARAGLAGPVSASAYSAAAIGWFEAARARATDGAATTEALMVRTGEALSNATGVNVDHEMSLLLDLEHAYEASARLIKAVDEMLAALLAMVR
ncbi:MAG TPA: flagellar hook-associated protein FlgK [Mesorhizobium sp.]|jgi:flagellar hook-associated protein 1 FlgK|nr:flagellar hook-associated protein FlgK [Mesorhizobium sp.]